MVLTLNTLPYFDKRDENNNERDYPPFALLEAIYMSWFTFEFLVSNVYVLYLLLYLHYYLGIHVKVQKCVLSNI